MANSETETVSAIKKLTEKVADAGENTIGSTRKLGDNINDSFRATFADSPLISGLVDIGASLGKDVMGMFGGEKKEPLTEAEKEAAGQRKEQREELKAVTQQLEANRNGQFESDSQTRSENEQIIDNLQDIKEVWEAGDNAEERREQARREEETLKLQERQNQLLEALAESKKEDEDDKLGFFDKIKENITLTFLGLAAFLKTLFQAPGKIFKSIVSLFGKFAKILGPIALIIGTVIGAFTGFNKATEIFGENASILEKIVSTIAGIFSGLTFGLIDIEPLARGIKSGVDLLTAVFTGSVSDVDEAWKVFTGMFDGMGDKMIAALSSAKDSIVKMFDPIVDWVLEGISNMFDSLKNTVNDLIVGMVTSLPGGEFVAKDLGLDVTGYNKREEEKDQSGENLYNRLEDNGLDDRLFGSDTMTKDAISKLTAEQNAKLQKYLLANEKADNKSKIILDLQEQLSKMGKESKEGSSSTVAVNAPTTVTNNQTNYVKPNARTSDSSFKTANL